MSKFLGRTAASISPYVPGEQPQDKKYLKLNTNECPYPPSPSVLTALRSFDYSDLSLYPDPASVNLQKAMADCYGLPASCVIAGGGSDELLAFAFMAFGDSGDKICFPDITYGFYRVYADLLEREVVEIPLREDFSIAVEDYFDSDCNIILANPNAPTGMVLSQEEIELILKNNPDRLVIIDEAYADFSPGCSAVPLIESYNNLLVIQTFSKSRALAGMRLGFAFGQELLIEGMNRIKFSFNPYNIDRISSDVGIAAIGDAAYLSETVAKIISTRERTSENLRGLGFEVLPSGANFIFASHRSFSGGELYLKLRERGILVRHFAKPRIDRFLRISIGTDQGMDKFIEAVEEILKG